MYKIKVINGPNLNMLGIREPGIYGKKTLSEIESELVSYGEKIGVSVFCFQSNCEGEIIDEIQACHNNFDAIILNAGAYTHYSYAILDALYSVKLPTIEVHLSDIYKREPFRQISVISPACLMQIYGKGEKGYFEAIDELVKTLSK